LPGTAAGRQSQVGRGLVHGKVRKAEITIPQIKPKATEFYFWYKMELSEENTKLLGLLSGSPSKIQLNLAERRPA
jgi:hypothetical protein